MLKYRRRQKMKNKISINDISVSTDPVSGRLIYRYELTPGKPVEDKSIAGLILKIKKCYKRGKK